MLPSVGDKKPQISLSRGVVLSQSTFHLVYVCMYVCRVKVRKHRMRCIHCPVQYVFYDWPFLHARIQRENSLFFTLILAQFSATVWSFMEIYLCRVTFQYFVIGLAFIAKGCSGLFSYNAVFASSSTTTTIVPWLNMLMN